MTIRVELLGTIRARDLRASILKLGWLVKVEVNFPRGGELTNPDHLLLLNREFKDYSENHSQYSCLAMAHRFASDAIYDGDDENQDTFDLFIELPFECEMDFIDPFSKNSDALDVGIFPLHHHRRAGEAGPLPSVKLLHLTLEEKRKQRAVQHVVERSYF